MSEAPEAAAPCAGCLDGLCGFCLHGWPAMPDLDCACHTVESVECDRPCNRCGGATARTTVRSIVDEIPGDVVGVWCRDHGCGWESVYRSPVLPRR